MKKIIADLHFHSKYSRAVSQQMNLETISRWGKIKGINLLTTSDFTHPLWLREIKAKLTETGKGIYKLIEEKNDPEAPLFTLTTEISCIYSQAGKGRRIHNLIISPDIETVEKVVARLNNLGANLSSDGRPILGLSSERLADLLFNTNPEILIIPAHIWTPWFSLYGSNSGFDNLKECFGKYSSCIYAVETGLSSDPEMNWRIQELNGLSIVSFSDAHSPAKLGREATVFSNPDSTANFSFDDLTSALKKNQEGWQIEKTIEFYPEEGKYHFTGHRLCHIRQTPEETKKNGKVCSVCGKSLTVGVLHRVKDLTNQEPNSEIKIENGIRTIYHPQKIHHPYVMLVPLLEIIAESLEATVSSLKTNDLYQKMIQHFKNEFSVLLETPPEKIKIFFGEKIADGIKRVREGNLVVDPGYDGLFGIVKIWHNKEGLENKPKQTQMNLF